MSEVAEKTAEVVADNVEEVIDGVVEVMEVVRTNVPLMIAVGVAGTAVGLGAGYFLARKVLEKEFEARLDDEIEQTKHFYAALNKVGEDGEMLSPGDVLRARGVEALVEYQGDVELEGEPYDEIVDEAQIAKMESKIQGYKKKRGDGVVETEAVPGVVNVFSDHTFDLEEEMKHRSSNAPYVIAHDEFFGESEFDFETESLVYYEGDSVLCGEDDIPKDTVFIGEDNLARFGHGSKDRNTVYIRNEKIQTDFEITRSTGSYVKEVLDMDENERELRHSENLARRRAFRRGEG